MAALSANLNRLNMTRPQSETFSYVVKSGVTVYQGSLVGIEASTGYVIPWAATTGTTNYFLGVAQAKVVGDGTLTVQVITSVILQNVAVTGLSTIADVGKKVYGANDQDLTNSAPAAGGIIGWVKAFRTATQFDVEIYSPAEYRVQAPI